MISSLIVNALLIGLATFLIAFVISRLISAQKQKREN